MDDDGSDVSDDDYRPDQDTTAEAEDRAQFGGPVSKKKSAKRPRARADDERDPRVAAKKAKTDHLWALLNSRPAGRPQPALTAPPAAQGPKSSNSLAALCRTVDPKQSKSSSDALWMRALGIRSPSRAPGAASSTPSLTSTLPLPAAAPSSSQPAPAAPSTAPSAAPDPGAAEGAAEPAAAVGGQQEVGPSASGSGVNRSMAAVALAAAREAASLGAVRSHSKVTVTETRRFAGQNIQVALQVDKNSKEAALAAGQSKGQAPAAAKSGLDAFLNEVEKKRKVSVLDKSKADWQQAKAGDTSMEEELEAHKRSDKQYLDKVDFLKRAELRQYEQERDQRLQSDVRFRARV
ncbi:BCNT-C domain-containing protein [Haematococcus lacustris]|uniref:BCNT-C domain-containing protein n=1 Tax=Haematococcus lacustris TaxID=44745 RepID=A0A699ZZE1_HAELA|nr:BCNT-C domain-containing protein [Haematococcus lacustris]